MPAPQPSSSTPKNHPQHENSSSTVTTSLLVARPTYPNHHPLTLEAILSKSIQSGTAGALAMFSNVLALMWVRTVADYQYRNGGTYLKTFRHLYAQGGIPRFYRGLPFALLQGPLCRFGDTAANTCAVTLFESRPELSSWNVGIKTVAGSGMAALFRVCLMPVDTCKVTMQVNGSIRPLIGKLRAGGPSVLFHGSTAALTSSFVGHFPWYVTFNFLSERIPPAETTLGELGRRAFIGFSASVFSDTCANSLYVVKVYKQSHSETLSYAEIVRRVTSESGVMGLLFRGLETKILANALQGLTFSVLWKYFETEIFRRNGH